MSCLSNKNNTIESKKMDIDGVNIHYRYHDGGDITCLFLHGIPCSSFMWRHVMSQLSELASCYAMDFVGMGDSDQPDIEYTYEDHIHYLTEFIKRLELSNIVLVMHGWGSVVGLSYAARHPDQIRGVVCLESHIRTVSHWEQLSLPVQSLISPLNDHEVARQKVLHENFFINEYLQMCSMEPLSEDVVKEYSRPFSTVASRTVLLQYLYELPTGRSDTPVTNAIHDYLHWLKNTTTPKLLFYGMPGFITPIDAIANAAQSWPAVVAVELPDAMHLAPESCPDVLASELLDWLSEQFVDGV